MNDLTALVGDPSHILYIYVVLWTFSALAHTMPAPDGKSSKGYQWIYNLLQFLLANLGKLQGIAGKPWGSGADAALGLGVGLMRDEKAPLRSKVKCGWAPALLTSREFHRRFAAKISSLRVTPESLSGEAKWRFSGIVRYVPKERDTMSRSREISMSSAAPAFSTPRPETAAERKVEARAHALAAEIDAPSLPLLELSVRDREGFFSAVLNPPSPNEYLRAAAKKYFRRNRP